jgi:hypothetical protein
VDPHHADADADPAFHHDADPDPTFHLIRFRILFLCGSGSGQKWLFDRFCNKFLKSYKILIS